MSNDSTTPSGGDQASSTADATGQASVNAPQAGAPPTTTTTTTATPSALASPDAVTDAAQTPAATTDASAPANGKPAMSLEDALAALKRANAEAASYRVKAKELDDLKRQLEDAKLTETDRLKKQVADAQAERDRTTTQAQERVVRAEIRSTARELGLKPELALRLMDYAALTFDDNGDPTNVGELLQQAAHEYAIPLTSGATATTPAAPPVSAAAAPAPRASAGAPAAPARSATQGGAGALTREIIERMTPREYQQRRADVQTWLEQHPNG